MSGGSSGDNAGDPIWNTEKGPNGYWAGTKGTFAGLGQGSCNIINGLQDSVIGILNIPGTVVDGIAWVEEKAGILDPNDSLRVGSIPSPDWSSDLVTHEGGEGWTDSHNWSKGLGAGGVEFITGAYWAKISKARKAAQATGLVDDAAEAAGKHADDFVKGACFVAGTRVLMAAGEEVMVASMSTAPVDGVDDHDKRWVTSLLVAMAGVSVLHGRSTRRKQAAARRSFLSTFEPLATDDRPKEVSLRIEPVEKTESIITPVDRRVLTNRPDHAYDDPIQKDAVIASKISTNRTSEKPSGRAGRFFRSHWLIAGLCLLAAMAFWRAGDTSSKPSESASLASTHATSVSARTPTTKNIESIRVGDTVLARDPTTGETRPKRVTEVFHRTSDHLRILTIRCPESGTVEELQTTNEHPFWIENTCWVNASALQPGQTLLQANGQSAILESTAYESHPERIPVFNLETADFHTYFVTAANSTVSPMLVHNCDAPKKTPKPRTKKVQPVEGAGSHTGFKRDPATGEITGHTTSDENGFITQRTDITGSAHGGVATPHTHVHGPPNVAPDGRMFPGREIEVRPARPNEIPKSGGN